MNHFRGYYFKHQKDGQTIAFIPGISKDGAFIQVVTPHESRCFHFLSAKFGKTIRIGNNVFSSKGIRIKLPDITGCVRYSKLSKLRSDIMGIFRFVPMECRHTIISMRHTLHGSLTIAGKRYNLNNGIGYIEGDSGCSFPRRYVWIHSNDFTENCSITLSIAEIPFCGLHFPGAFAVVMLHSREYRLATYYGAKTIDRKDTIVFRQRRLTLVVRILSQGTGYPLASPRKGAMSGIIKEHNNAHINIRLWDGVNLLCDLYSRHAGYERFPDS